jgi:lactate dehydrogenase-like 2-hydroxyacid dehydrogenase
VFDGRFPSEDQIRQDIKSFDPNFIGCHLSHKITSDMLKNENIYGVLTSTAGFNHIERPEKDDILVTHTPGVLYETVADYTIALIMANLRNLIDLNRYVWEGNWTPEDKWDLDQNLSSVIDNKTVGIIGLGEIGTELMKRLFVLGINIQYYDIERSIELEKLHPGLEYQSNIKDIFKQCDIVTLHVPLNDATRHLIDAELLKEMKNDALLVNTARGAVIDFEDLLRLLENDEININIAFDVYPEEPIDPKILERFKKIKEENPQMRIILMPHNASADADTRGKMDILFLEDLITMINSENLYDIEKIHLIPQHEENLQKTDWRIFNYWEQK